MLSTNEKSNSLIPMQKNQRHPAEEHPTYHAAWPPRNAELSARVGFLCFFRRLSHRMSGPRQELFVLMQKKDSGKSKKARCIFYASIMSNHNT